VRNAVVTGAAGGMGRAITEALLQSGRRVVLVDRDPESLRQFAAKMGDSTFPIQLDITDAKSVDRLPDLIPNAFKPIDILINNAGHDIGGRTPLRYRPADDWSSIIQTNLIGLMRVTRSILPDMSDATRVTLSTSARSTPYVSFRTWLPTHEQGGRAYFTEYAQRELAGRDQVTEMQPGSREPVSSSPATAATGRRKKTTSGSSRWRSIRRISHDRSYLRWTSHPMFRWRR